MISHLETEIAEIVGDWSETFSYFGLRADDERYAVGDILPESRQWTDGDPTDRLLDGTSAIRCAGAHQWQVRQALFDLLGDGSLHGAYSGRHLYLLGSDEVGEDIAEDEGEILMRDPQVLAVYDREGGAWIEVG